MIQRIQTLYMLLGGILAILFAAAFPLGYRQQGTFKAMDIPVYAFLGAMTGAILIANIFNFKKRKLQVVINRVALVIILAMAAFMVWEYVSLISTQEALAPSVGLVSPLVVIVLIVLANRGITKDEELVRSADRFR